MKVIVIKAYDFPLGGAPQNRALGICRGLIEQNIDVEVHVFGPSKFEISLNHKKYQVYKSVKIWNHSWRWCPAKKRQQQIIGVISGYFKTIIALIQSNRYNSIDYILFNCENILYVLPIFVLSRLLKIRLVRDINEFPLYFFSASFNTNRTNRLQKMLEKLSINLFDDLIIMTQTLIRYYKPLARKNVRIIHLPMTVDLDRFIMPIEDLKKQSDIVYCGDLSQSKDGVLTLIQSFALITSEFPKHKLILIGHNRNISYMAKLKAMIIELGLFDRVVLTGYINSELIPDKLAKARLLVLARPDNIQARGGFPTKLGEYLATGIPVAVTAVGEIPLYLIDGFNAFFARPDDIVSFANAMRRALCDDALSLKVGNAGRATAMQHFSHSKQGKLLTNFLSREKLAG